MLFVAFPRLAPRRTALIPAALGIALVSLVTRVTIAAEKTLFERAVEGWMGVVAVVGELADRHDGDRHDGDRHDGDRHEHGDHERHRHGERHGDRGEHHRGGPAGDPPHGPTPGASGPRGPRPPERPWGGEWRGWQAGRPLPPRTRGRVEGMMPWGPGGMDGGPRPPFGAGPGQSDRMHDEMMRRHADAMRKIDEILDHVRRIDAQLGGRPPRHADDRHAGPERTRRPDAERPRDEGDRSREEGGRESRPERGRRSEVEPPQRGEADAERPRQRLDIPEDMRRMMQQKLDEGRRRMEQAQQRADEGQRRMEQAQQRADEGQRRSRELEERIRGLEAELERLRSQQR